MRIVSVRLGLGLGLVLGLGRAIGTAAAAPTHAEPVAVAISGRLTLLERRGESSDDLGNAVVWLEALDAKTTAPAPTQRQIAMARRQFVPHVVVVPPGGSVAFPNQDPFDHNIFSNAEGAAFDLGLYGRGESRAQVFRREGVVPVFCNIHSRMSAQVVVTASPWVTQPGADGRWQLEGVPPGRYRLRVWHERTPSLAREIVVGVDAVTGADVELDARGYRFVQHKDKFGRDYKARGERY